MLGMEMHFDDAFYDPFVVCAPALCHCYIITGKSPPPSRTAKIQKKEGKYR